MKTLMAGTGLAILLLLPVGANAQQGRQQTDDQANFKHNVQALPSTHKRRQIIRSELSTPTNRGHNSIVVFKIDQKTGKLKWVQHHSTEGDWPRNFAIDPSGQFLLVANQRSDNIVFFLIDERTGQLRDIGQTNEIPSPVCLRFV